MSDLVIVVCLVFATGLGLLLVALGAGCSLASVLWYFERRKRQEWQEFAGLLEHKIECDCDPDDGDGPDIPDGPDDDPSERDVLGLNEWKRNYPNGDKGA